MTKITFPFRIQQIDEHSISIMARPMTVPLINTKGLDEMAGDLSAKQKDELVDKLYNLATSEVIKSLMEVEQQEEAKEARPEPAKY